MNWNETIQEYNKSGQWTYTDPMEKPYTIEKKERRTCFGVPGYIDEWIVWQRFENASERDKELDRLISLKIGTFRKNKEAIRWLRG